MKTMTCKQLGGACDIKLQAETFGQMAELPLHAQIYEIIEKKIQS